MVGRNQALELKAALLCHYIRLELRDWRRVKERSQRQLTRFLANVDASQEWFGMMDFAKVCPLLASNLIETELFLPVSIISNFLKS
jgi:hypothetical protein